MKNSKLSNHYSYLKSGSGYTFSTTKGTIYNLAFIIYDFLNDLIGEPIVLEIVFGSVGERHEKSDRKIGLTIIHIIENVFEKQNNVVFYVCDLADKKQDARDKLFTIWCKRHNKFYKRLKFKYGDIYGALLFRTDNQFKEKIYGIRLDMVSEDNTATTNKPD